MSERRSNISAHADTNTKMPLRGNCCVPVASNVNACFKETHLTAIGYFLFFEARS